MAHILNKPVTDNTNTRVISGYGIMQPRVGINLDISYFNLFTKIFAGAGGIDNYTNAISDLYQDNFKEGIFTGKGIYDLQVFSKILNNKFPENTVQSPLSISIILLTILSRKYLSCATIRTAPL